MFYFVTRMKFSKKKVNYNKGRQVGLAIKCLNDQYGLSKFS